MPPTLNKWVFEDRNDKNSYFRQLRKADSYTEDYYILECILNDESLSSIARRFGVKYSIVQNISRKNQPIIKAKERDKRGHTPKFGKHHHNRPIQM